MIHVDFVHGYIGVNDEHERLVRSEEPELKAKILSGVVPDSARQ